MEILHNASFTTTGLTRKEAMADLIISVVQSFVQTWIKYESVLQKEIAMQHKALNDAKDSTKTNSFIDYGNFYGVSSRLFKKKQITMGELSSSLSVPLSSATRIVDALVTGGYLKRKHDPKDRRIVRISLTQEGIRLHHTIERFTTERVRSILSVLEEEEQRSLLEVLGKVLPALENLT